MHIPFLSFEEINTQIKAEILSAFENFFNSSQYILATETEKFEKAYADFNEVKYCIGTSNGLDALSLALRSLNIGVGDEVIIPSHTFIATMLAVTHSGAKPVLVEPDPLTYNMDPSKIEAAITSNTKAIIPVHLYGQACVMNQIMSVAKKHDLFVVEDNAQSQGAKFSDIITGSWGHINATSFYPAKNLGALGDAGAITTNDESLARTAKLLRNYGSEKKYNHQYIGYNMRMDECQAAFLRVKLKYLQGWTKKRQEIAAMYNDCLKDIAEIILPFKHPDADHVYHLFVIRTTHRTELQQYLHEKGVGTLIHYPVANHLQPAYKHFGYKKGSFPLAEEIADTCLSLPLWPGMQKMHVDYVAQTIKSFFANKFSASIGVKQPLK
jgi:dTDP-4-amino-4,6-dideoxygalactose transaminase